MAAELLAQSRRPKLAAPCLAAMMMPVNPAYPAGHGQIGQMAFQVVGVVGGDPLQGTTYCVAVPVSFVAVSSAEALGKPGRDELPWQCPSQEPSDDAESETSAGTETWLHSGSARQLEQL